MRTRSLYDSDAALSRVAAVLRSLGGEPTDLGPRPAPPAEIVFTGRARPESRTVLRSALVRGHDIVHAAEWVLSGATTPR